MQHPRFGCQLHRSLDIIARKSVPSGLLKRCLHLLIGRTDRFPSSAPQRVSFLVGATKEKRHVAQFIDHLLDAPTGQRGLSVRKEEPMDQIIPFLSRFLEQLESRG